MSEWQVVMVPALARALLHFLWQGALIGLAVAVTMQLMRDARPQWRYAIACFALLACVLLPITGLLFELAAHLSTPTASQGSALSLAALVSGRAEVPEWSSTFEGALPWIVTAWATGAGALSLRMTLGVFWIHGLRNTPQDARHASWQIRLDALTARFGLKPVALRLVDGIRSPASAGWWRPVVLLPTALIMRMPADLIEALLAHELAHIRRHDYLVNLLQGVAEALLFYHPVTWWLSRRIRAERELIADSLAVQVIGEPRRLALALSELSDCQHTQGSSLHLAQAAHGGHLMSRIEHLIRPGHRNVQGRIAFPLLGLAVACVAFYAHAQIGDADRATPAKAPAVTHATTVHAGQAPREAFALVRKGSNDMTLSGSTDDIHDIESIRSSIDGDFIWFRRGNQAYVVTDPATVARTKDAWQDSSKLGAQMEALGNEMEVHGAKMEALGARMEKLSADQAPSPAMEAASRRMEALGKQQRTLAAQQAKLAASMNEGNDAQREQIDMKMEALSAQQDALAEQMDQQAEVMDAESRRVESHAQPMEALSRQMEEASKPMEALGKRMETLGKQQEKLSAQAEIETRQLLNDAIAKGLAKPAPETAAK
jgi:beta-lactamase regulating signal transducer with metallopeptidase domain